MRGLRRGDKWRETSVNYWASRPSSVVRRFSRPLRGRARRVSAIDGRARPFAHFVRHPAQICATDVVAGRVWNAHTLPIRSVGEMIRRWSADMGRLLSHALVRFELARRQPAFAVLPLVALAVTLLQAGLTASGAGEDLCILCGCDLGVHMLYPCPWLGCQWLYPLVNINCCAHFGEACWQAAPA